MSNFEVSSDIDTFLRKSTKEEAATFLGLEDTKAQWGQITGTLSDQTDLQAELDAKAPLDSPTFNTSVKIGANFPDDAKLLMTDNGTTDGNGGALVKQNNKLFIGCSETVSSNWVFQTETDGKKVFKSPTNGGIRFGSTGSFLDHYKFGTFSPKLASGDGSIVQSVYSVRQANYVRIGDLVQVNIRIQINNFDTAWKTSTKNWKITDLPYSAIGNHNIEIRPIRGWMDLGDVNITGALQSGNDYLWVEKFVNNGTTAGQGANTSRVNGNSFATHPFNFSTGSFEFIITGAYKTNET